MTTSIGIHLEGRIFSITGGASGMGLATAQLLARHGAGAIWIADKQTHLFDKVRRELAEINKETKVYTDDVDVGDRAQVDAWVQRIVDESGGIHGAVNGAGLPQEAQTGNTDPHVALIDDDAWDRILRVNLNGVKYCTRAQARAMLKMPQGSNGSIVNITSIATTVHEPSAIAYSISKAAADFFTASMAKDLAVHGFRLNSVQPGLTTSPMMKYFVGDATPQDVVNFVPALHSIITPDDVARVIVWLLSENSLHVNGASLPVGASPP